MACRQALRGAELIAEHWNLSRQANEAFALESHRRAARAIAEGAFQAEIVPVIVDRRKTPVVVATDEGSLECLRSVASAELGDPEPTTEPRPLRHTSAPGSNGCRSSAPMSSCRCISG